MYKYYSIYKPFGMLSQFTGEAEHKTLAELEFNFPKDVYPVGRLDADSEGLLLLTNDKRVNSRLLDPLNKHLRTYLVQVEGTINNEAITLLEAGMILNEKGKRYNTQKAKAVIVDEPDLPPRNPPVRFRKNIPTSWIRLTLTEGKNRQVRKMTAKAGFPTLRLVRISMEDLTIEKLEPGLVIEMKKEEFYKKLKLGTP